MPDSEAHGREERCGAAIARQPRQPDNRQQITDNRPHMERTSHELDHRIVGDDMQCVEITLDEGRNRQIRRILSALDFEVLRLVRTAIGPLVLGDLAKGAWRDLSDREVAALRGE